MGLQEEQALYVSYRHYYLLIVGQNPQRCMKISQSAVLQPISKDGLQMTMEVNNAIVKSGLLAVQPNEMEHLLTQEIPRHLSRQWWLHRRVSAIVLGRRVPLR